jgi:hypothetical protein
MIDAGQYTSGRIAVANLSASIHSLELRRAEGAGLADLIALSRLLLLRGDVLGRIADQDRAELIATEAMALSSDTATVLYMRAGLAGRFHRFDEANGLLDEALAAGHPPGEIDRERAALLQATGRYEDALVLRRRILGFKRWVRSPRCWRKWTDGWLQKTAMRRRWTPTMACRRSRAASCCSNGA